MWISKGGKSLEKRFANIFSVKWSQVALCILSYGRAPSVNYAQKRPEGVQGWRQVPSWQRDLLSAWMETRKLFVPHSKCQTTDLWLSPYSPWWHQAGLLFVGGINHVSKLLVMSVNTVLALSFSVLWQWFLKSRRGEQEICPAYLSQILRIYNNRFKR